MRRRPPLLHVRRTRHRPRRASAAVEKCLSRPRVFAVRCAGAPNKGRRAGADRGAAYAPLRGRGSAWSSDHPGAFSPAVVTRSRRVCTRGARLCRTASIRRSADVSRQTHCVPDDQYHRYPRAPRDRPRLSAAQASRQGAGVLDLLRHGARPVPGGVRRTVHGRAAARGRRGGAGAAGQGQGPRWGARRRARAVRQRPPVRGLLPARGGAERCVLQRDEGPVHRAARTAGADQAAADRGARAARPRRCRPRTGAVRAARMDSDGRGGGAGRAVPRVGRLPLCTSGTGSDAADARRSPAPPLRAAPGARRRQALLGVVRRGRQTAAVG